MSSRLRPDSLGRGVDVIATNIAVTLVLLEACLRLYGGITGNQLLIARNIDAYRLQPNHDYGRLWTNSEGYPSREFVRETNGRHRLALIGDSFAVGAVRQDVNFASLIEARRPDVEVYNFGVSAIGPDEYALILKQEALSFDPEAVIVSLFVGNDIAVSNITRAAIALEDHAVALFTRRAWRIGREWYRRRISPAAPLQLPQLSHPATPERGFNLSRQTYLGVQTERLVFFRRSVAAEIAPRWQHTLEMLREMARLARDHHVAFGVVIIPDEMQANPDVLHEVLTVSGTPSADVDIDLPQQTLRDFCRDERIPCLDLLPQFAGRRDAYLPQDTHWNEKGNMIAADAIVPWLTTSLLRQDSSRR